MKTFGIAFSKTFGFLSAILAIFFVLSVIVKFNENNFYLNTQNYEFIGGNESSLNKIFILELNGLITNKKNESIPILNSDIIYVNKIEEIFDYLSSEVGIKAVLISINSPGGSVSGSNRFYNIIKNFKTNTNVPIFVHVNELLASGAMWSLASSDKIYASYGAMIGSIGVKGPSWFVYNDPVSIKSDFFGPNISTLKGIDYYQPYSGESKDIFNPFRKPTTKEINKIQEMLDSIYEKFVNIISKNRKIDKNYIKKNIGSMFYESEKAKFHNLIDDVISFNEAKKKIINSLNLEDDYQLIKINNKNNFINKISNINSNINNIYNNQISTDICNLANHQFLLIGKYNFSDC